MAYVNLLETDPHVDFSELIHKFDGSLKVKPRPKSLNPIATAAKHHPNPLRSTPLA
jgi:hypothetical protein